MTEAASDTVSSYSYLQTVRGQLWRWDLKSLVGSVLFGVVLTVLGAGAERLDTALTGGAFVILGAINFYTFAALATLFFRLPGGIITGETNALISIATGASPMSPWFVPTNAVFAIVYGLIVWKLRMDEWWHHLVAMAVGVWTSMLVILWGLLVTIELPLNIAITSYVVTSLAGTIGGTILSIIIANAVDKSRVLE